MSQEKFLTPEEFQNLFKSDEELVFDTSFPFENLTAPPRTLWTMWHWSERESGISTGTAYNVRVGFKKAPIKVDVYSLRNEGNKLPIKDVEPKSIGYHHIHSLEEFPSFVIDKAPDELIDKAERVLKDWKNNWPTKN